MWSWQDQVLVPLTVYPPAAHAGVIAKAARGTEVGGRTTYPMLAVEERRAISIDRTVSIAAQAFSAPNASRLTAP
jgi:hypothetical protein